MQRIGPRRIGKGFFWAGLGVRQSATRGALAGGAVGGGRSSLAVSSLACPAPLEPCTALCASLPSPPRLPRYARLARTRARAVVAEHERPTPRRAGTDELPPCPPPAPGPRAFVRHSQAG